MTETILQFIQLNTGLTVCNKPEGLTSKELEVKYNEIIRDFPHSNSVPTLGSIIGRLVDTDQIIADHNGHGKIIYLHLPTLEALKKEAI